MLLLLCLTITGGIIVGAHAGYWKPAELSVQVNSVEVQ
jgi:hypothetical protein